MMKVFLSSCLLPIAFSLYGQEQADNVTKGIKPIATNEKSAGQTYAVVVGISDYQDEGIPDLRFADKDAEAFAGFLQSPDGVIFHNDKTNAR